MTFAGRGWMVEPVGSGNEPENAFSSASWGLWLWWLAASTAGWGIGAAIGAAASSSGDIILGGYLRLAGGGIVAGVLHWLVLRQRVASLNAWVPATVGAVAVAGVLVFAVGFLDADFGWVLGAGSLGLMLGLLQWPILQPRIPRAGWWIAACTLGWIVGGPLGGLAGWATLGAGYGAITGAVLVWLLRQPERASRV